jgi:hypothetical protein
LVLRLFRVISCEEKIEEKTQNGREKMATTTSNNNIKSLHEKLRVDSGSFQQLQQGLFFLFIAFFLGKN